MSFKLTIGKMAFAGTDLYTNEAIIAIPENKEYNLKFLYFYLSSYNWSSLTDGNEKVKGKTLNKESIGRIKLPIISLPEQQRIVSYLDAEFAKIEALKSNAEKQLQAAKDLFQAALKELLTPKDGWVEKKLKEIGKTQTGCTPSMSNKDYYNDNYIPFVKPSEINYDGLGGINYETQMLSKLGANAGRVFPAKSIFMVCIGATISKLGYSVRDVSCNQQINVITPNEMYDYKYIYYAMLHPHFIQKVIKEGTSAQATLPIISKGKWEVLSIKIPSLSEQQRIADRLDALSANVKALQTNYTETITLCNDLKQALLKKVFG